MTEPLIQSLHERVAAVCPVHGVRVGRWDDRASWRIDFSGEATSAQKAAALDALARFDPLAEDRPRILTKLAIVERLSDAELQRFLALRAGAAETARPLTAAAQIRLALRWDSAEKIDRLAPDVRQGFAAVFGPARMEELLG